MIVQEAVISKNRFNIILSAALIWAGLISIRLFYFTVSKRDAAFTKMNTESLEKGRIKAMRGRILSSEGEILAYSKRISTLNLKTDISSNMLNGLVEILEKELGLSRRQLLMKLSNANGKSSVVIADNLLAKEIEELSKYFSKNSDVFIKMNFERVYNARSKKLGKTAVEDGEIVGISGFEAKYDHMLKGTDLVYEVMVDRQNQVIEKTFKEISKLKPGRDIHLTEEEWP